ncbi:hypothetical protein B9479_008280, partial [Cryptococcus floricola]
MLGAHLVHQGAGVRGIHKESGSQINDVQQWRLPTSQSQELDSKYGGRTDRLANAQAIISPAILYGVNFFLGLPFRKSIDTSFSRRRFWGVVNGVEEEDGP